MTLRRGQYVAVTNLVYGWCSSPSPGNAHSIGRQLASDKCRWSPGEAFRKTDLDGGIERGAAAHGREAVRINSEEETVQVGSGCGDARLEKRLREMWCFRPSRMSLTLDYTPGCSV
jgi:hypothetical protein